MRWKNITYPSKTELPEFDDVGDALREGRSLRPARAYRIQLALESLEFRAITVADAEVEEAGLGQQASGARVWPLTHDSEALPGIGPMAALSAAGIARDVGRS